MLHTKFHGNRSTGSREEDFWRVFTIYGHGSHLGHVTSIMSINFHFLEPESLHIKFGFDWPSGFLEKQVLSFVCKWPWAKVKKWPWPSILTYLHFFSWFQVTGCKYSEKSTVFTFSYRKFLFWLLFNVPVNLFLSHVETEPPIPGYYQYFWGILAQGNNTPTRRGSNPGLPIRSPTL